ncbi:PQQ-dependent sugar dehydrogenase [Luethyella okanaganae]|uniref:PQQ-dependent sugar dehydrogenase n=1 Tax=Luethyella okanaganae TaxID=69372 RepID=A0ABW1VFW8_9MICO
MGLTTAMRRWRIPTGLLAGGAVFAAAASLAACTPRPAPGPTSTVAPEPRPIATAPMTATAVLPPVQPAGDVNTIATNLDAPWSILRLPNGATLISERDTGDILELLDGGTRVAAEVAGVAHGGEGGLLGLAHLGDAASGEWIYAYFTSDSDNRIVRMPLLGAPGELGLGAPELVLGGIPMAGNHDGGRIAFGPDGMLYATTGDAGDPDNAQNRESLGGKILRLTPTGGVPDGNPFGTLVWTLGHRNPQGIGWDSHGRLWASEFGQSTWDELNLIEAGRNYGWPIVEGAAGDPAYVDPVTQWSTAEASPSGLAVVSDTVFVASLRGERIWSYRADSGEPPVAWFTGRFGRFRDVAAGPDGTLWFLSNNTDGRGDPSDGDDRLLQVPLAVAP